MDRYRIAKGDGAPYLCTLTILHWLPVFNAGDDYARIITGSLDFCRRNKGLLLHAYVIMIDHVHLLARHPDDLSGVIRDFKSWTAKRILEMLHRDGCDRWLRLMEIAAQAGGSDGSRFQVWQEGFHPKVMTSDAMILQKLDYVHRNPVHKGFVMNAEDWRWSSARNYISGDDSVLEIDRVAPLIV